MSALHPIAATKAAVAFVRRLRRPLPSDLPSVVCEVPHQN